jgi:uncharacterized cupin superfamily protein
VTGHPNVASTGGLKWPEQAHGERFEFKRKSLGAATGGEKLGCSLYEVPPGKRAWPRHYHLANEEAIFVLEGRGTLRIGEKEVTISAGDYATLLVGEEGSHQTINTSDAPLRYLCFSTMVAPDVTVYPDSNKVSIFGGSAPGGPKEKRTFNKFLKTDAEVGYYEGEE